MLACTCVCCLWCVYAYMYVLVCVVVVVVVFLLLFFVSVCVCRCLPLLVVYLTCSGCHGTCAYVLHCMYSLGYRAFIADPPKAIPEVMHSKNVSAVIPSSLRPFVAVVIQCFLSLHSFFQYLYTFPHPPVKILESTLPCNQEFHIVPSR